MKKIMTTSTPEEFKILEFVSENERTIYLGTPFYGDLEEDEKSLIENNLSYLLILDLNVINDIRSGKNQTNVLKLFQWAAKNNVEITPVIGLLEQQRTHGNPQYAYDEYIKSLRENFKFHIADDTKEKSYDLMHNFQNEMKNNVELLRDYIVIIKYFYHKNLTLEEKITQFIKMMYEDNLPIFAYSLFLGCSFFHVKANSHKYDKKIVGKIQKDMNLGENLNEKSLNMASDLMLIMAVSELFYNQYDNKYDFSYLASGDLLIKHALNEICFHQIHISKDNRKYPVISLVPETACYNDTIELLQNLITEYAKKDRKIGVKEEESIRRNNLERKVKNLLIEMEKCQPNCQ